MVLDENGWTTVESARVLRDRMSTWTCHFTGFAKAMRRRLSCPWATQPASEPTLAASATNRQADSIGVFEKWKLAY